MEGGGMSEHLGLYIKINHMTDVYNVSRAEFQFISCLRLHSLHW